MKVKICLYSEPTPGATLVPLTDELYVEVGFSDGVFTGMTEAVLSVIRDAEVYVNPEMITQIEAAGVNRMLDLTNIVVALADKGLVLLVGETLGAPVGEKNSAEIQVSIVGNVTGGLPMITDYYSRLESFDIIGIIQDQVEKYRIGDPMLVPESEISRMTASMKEMQAKGLPISNAYQSALINQLSRYGFILYYINIPIQ
jgi:hypothetical protein